LTAPEPRIGNGSPTRKPAAQHFVNNVRFSNRPFGVKHLF
jgi:hypothetical protein